MGIGRDITLDGHGLSFFATLPANIDKEVPTIGFIAHMDTSPDMTGKDVSPRIGKDYDGSDIALCAEENIILSPAQFPDCAIIKGGGGSGWNKQEKLCLVPDDKAGIAEIVSAVSLSQRTP